MTHGLKQRFPIKYDNIRILCEVFQEDKYVKGIYINQGDIIIINDKYYDRNEDIVGNILKFLPEEYGY